MQLGARALGPEHPGDGVHEDEGADLGGGVELDRLPGEGVAVPVPAAGAEDVAHEAGVGAAGEGDVEEPGSGDDDVTDPVGAEKAGAQQFGDGGGGLSGRAGELEGDVGGVVAAATRSRGATTTRSGTTATASSPSSTARRTACSTVRESSTGVTGQA